MIQNVTLKNLQHNAFASRKYIVNVEVRWIGGKGKDHKKDLVRKVNKYLFLFNKYVNLLISFIQITSQKYKQVWVNFPTFFKSSESPKKRFKNYFIQFWSHALVNWLTSHKVGFVNLHLKKYFQGMNS